MQHKSLFTDMALKNIFAFAIAVLFVQACTINHEGPAPEAGTEWSPNSKWSERRAFEFERLKDPETGAIPTGIRARELAFARRLPTAEAGSRGLGWVKRGPFNIGGRTRAIALDIQDEDIILAGGVTGGMWRSDNGGQSWEKTTDPDQLHSVNCIVQDTRPGHENTWYYGTGEEFYGVVSGTSFTSLFSGDGIFKSTDGGHTWTPLASTQSGTPQAVQDNTYDHVWNVVVDTQILDQDVVLAAVYNGIIRSEDGGQTWTEVLGFNSSASEFTGLLQVPSGAFYATLSADGLGRGVFRSEDGINWTQLNFPLTGLYRRIVATYNPQNDSELYFLLEGPTSENSIGHALFKYTYLSGDGSGEGGIWEERSAHLPQTPCVLNIGTDFDFATFGTQGSFDICISHHPTDENVIFIGGRNIFRSTDGFTSQTNTKWMGGYRCNVENPRDYSYPNHHPDQHYMLFLPSDPNVMISANDGGVYRTDNCLADSVSWTPLNNGYVTTQFYTVAMEQGNATSDFVMGGMQDNGSWSTGSLLLEDPWKEVHNGDGSFCAIPEGMDFVISSSQQGRMQKKQLDAQGNVVNAKRIDPTNGPGALFINPFLLDPQTHNEVYIGGGKTLWRLDSLADIALDGDLINPYDNDHWENISSSFISFSGGNISALDKPRIDNSVIYYGSTVGRLWKLEDLYADPIRTEITADGFPTNAWTSSVACNDLNRDEILVSFSNYNVLSIWHSNDGGANWQAVSGNLEENPDGTGAGPAVYGIEIYPSDPPVYFAATSVGLFSTDQLDGMNTVWEMEGPSDIGNVIVNMVSARGFDGKIAIGTHGNGVYTSSLDPVPAVGVDENQPEFAIQVWPNPFTDELRIAYKQVANAPVQIEIRDQSGKLVHQEALGVRSVGNHTWTWSPAELPEGIYLFTLRSGNMVRSGKILHKNG